MREATILLIIQKCSLMKRFVRLVQAVWHIVQDAGWKNIRINNEEDFKKISGLIKKGGFAELADSPKFYL